MAIVWAVAVVLAPSSSFAIYEDDDGTATLGGSFRTVNFVSDHFGGQPAGGGSQSILRLTLDGTLDETFRYEIQAVALANASSATGSAGLVSAAGPRGSGLRYRMVDDTGRLVDDDSLSVLAQLDRFNFRFAFEWGDLTVGRQAMTFGKAYFWNPLDVFLAFDATSFDRDYKRGVDAVRLDVPLGDFSGVTVAGVLGRADDGHAWYRSALLARGFTTVFDWDVSAQMGKVFGGLHLGGATSGELGPVELRIEGAYFHALSTLRPDNAIELVNEFTGVVGVGRAFGFEQSTLNLQLEYLYNGAGRLDLARTFELVSAGFVRQAGEHTVAALASFDPWPLLTLSVATLVSFDDNPSVLVQPGFAFSASDEVEVLGGALLAMGKRPTATGKGLSLQSEFGTYPNLFYVEVKVYF